ncbi:unnamed protein product [Penicillium salamii]|uniref:Nephrocystin 3-like N-terminal domain-containing protein n=1 Tax=Penicillium salamii TaxID=1612424 RepID=A0A9W4J5Q6_9EURO|nr:unnamed protein product [Penicillium salamii]
MKFFCCSKGDQSGGESEPPRPTHVPDKPPAKIAGSSANTAAPAIPSPTLSEEVSPIQEKPKHHEKSDLWKEAFNSSTTDAINDVINQTREKYTEWQKGSLKIKRKSGDDIVVCDVTEKILTAALQAQKLITNMVSTDIQRRDAMFASSEYLAKNLAYYALVDTHFRDDQAEGGENLDTALVKVYTAILNYAAEVTKVQQESTLGRIGRSVKTFDEQRLTQLDAAIKTQQVEAEKWTDLVETLRDRSRAQKILDDVDENLAISKKIYSKLLDDQENEIMRGISSLPFSATQRRTQGYRTPDTGTWFLHSKEYKDWKSIPGSVLWLYGVVIQDIEKLCEEDSSKSLAYWYFEFTQSNSQSVENMMRSLIRQLSRSPLAPSVRNCWEHSIRKEIQPSRETITTMLDDVCSDMPSDVFLILDALDECPTDIKERQQLLSLLIGLAEAHRKNIHILATGRPEQDIKAAMEKFSSVDLEKKLARDVEFFVRAALEKEYLQQADEEIKTSIVKALLDTEERRFRWADLQLKRFEDCPTDDDIREALRTIPQTLEETYQSILDKIKQKKKQHLARQMLMLCAFAGGPLSVRAVAFSASLRLPSFVLDICTSSLLSVSEETVRLAHSSVKEFLVVSKDSDDGDGCRFSEIAAHEMLATKTIDLLLKQTEELNEETAMNQPYLIYAACHWHTHIAALGDIFLWPVGLPEKVDFLFTEPTIYLNWSRIENRAHSSLHWNRIPQHCSSPIHVALDLSLVRTVDNMADQGADALRDGIGFILMTAVTRGHLELVDSLLKKNLPINERMARDMVSAFRLDEASEFYETSKMRLKTVMNTMREVGLLQDSSQNSDKNLPEWVLSIAVRNWTAGLEIIRPLLDWHDMGLVSLNLPDDLVSAVVWNARYKDEIFDLLFATYHDQLTIPPDILDPKSGVLMCGPGQADIFANLVIRKSAPFMRDRTMKSMAENFTTKHMELVLQACPDIRVTEDVLAGAALNEFNPGMLSFLWPRREQGASITEDILIKVTSRYRIADVLKLLINDLGSGIQLSDHVMEKVIEHQEGMLVMKMLCESQKVTFETSAKMIEIAILRSDDPLEMLEILDLFRNNGKSEAPVTESMISAAAGHHKYANSLISYLSRMQEQPISVTESVLINAASQSDPLVVDTLLEKCPEVPLSDQVFLAAGSNAQVLSRLLDRRSEFVPIDQIVANLASENPSPEVLNLLIDRKFLDVDEQLLENMAGRHQTLAAILSRAPHMPITHRVLLEATNDPQSIRLLLDKGGIDDLITEDVLIAPTRRSYDLDRFQQVVQAIIHRKGAAPITENVFQAVSCNPHLCRSFMWLFDQPRSSEEPFTEGILIAAANCCELGPFQQIVKAIISRTGSAPITGNVIKKVLCSFGLFELSPWLLNQPRSSDEPFTEDILIAATEHCNSDQFKQVVEAMINRTGSAPVTESVFLAVLSVDGYRASTLCGVFPWLYGQRQSIHSPSTEDILLGAMKLLDSTRLQNVVSNIIDHMGSAPITERMLRGILCNGPLEAFPSLFDQRQDPKVTLEDICDSILRDMEAPAEGKMHALVCLMPPCDDEELGTTRSLLAKYPYDFEHEDNYGFDDLVNFLVRDFTTPFSDFHRAADLVLERCGLVAVENFLNAQPNVVISDTLLQAAKRNVIANRDELMSLLEKERNRRAMAIE